MRESWSEQLWANKVIAVVKKSNSIYFVFNFLYISKDIILITPLVSTTLDRCSLVILTRKMEYILFTQKHNILLQRQFVVSLISGNL